MSVLELRDPAHLVSRRARGYWTVRATLGWFAVVAVEVLVLLASDASAQAVVPVAVATGVAALTHVLVMPQWRFRVHRWEITDTAAYTQSGWFTQERRIAPLARVQTVDTRRGPLEQLFGLADVTVTTASAKGPIKIHALDGPVAEHIVQWLTERAQATAGDGT
ncbi:PH domain-containing protein [uncultured Jatrophihabitans sp.]|uniref:PH domain-containing protein n=1 Tax=uncultured Jatrophihabitans sp. TaxID=1610747 RepID=UPI0035C9DD88